VHISNQKIIFAFKQDPALYWVHSLLFDKKLIFKNDNYVVFYSEKFNLYFYYWSEFVYDFDDVNANFHLFIKNISEKNNVHCLTSVWPITIYFDRQNINNFHYSYLNYNSETTTESKPFNLYELKNIKYYFTSTNIASFEIDKTNTKKYWKDINKDKIKLDYKYSLIYFFFKYGFNFFQRGKLFPDISNRLNKVFLYTKNYGENSDRFKRIDSAIKTNKIYQKHFSDEDYFWYEFNHDKYHIPFLIDYNICKFNLIMETLPVTNSTEYFSLYLSEKTLKGIIITTPCYICLQHPIYQILKNFGFYFLNEEFGKYDENTYEQNYTNFCNWLKDASNDELNRMFEKTYIKSMNNKKILEDWIYSDKIEEINLLINS
jgi:hypothetical protein